jgi:P27 family predicted phage terminase small subunit
LPASEPHPAQCPNVPPPPPYLRGHAHAEWVRVAEELHRLGLLTSLDLNVLGAYCHTFAVFRTAVEELDRQNLALLIERKHGNGGSSTISNPLVSVAAQAGRDLVRLGAELGLSPAARTRINTAEPDPPSKFQGLLGGDGDPPLRLV